MLLHHSLGVFDLNGVAVKSDVGRCGLTIEEAFRRIEQFSLHHQSILLAGLAQHFDMGSGTGRDSGCRMSPLAKAYSVSVSRLARITGTRVWPGHTVHRTAPPAVVRAMRHQLAVESGFVALVLSAGFALDRLASIILTVLENLAK